MINIKECVSGGARVIFSYYREGELWYTTKNGDLFPVPIDDTEGAVFLNEDKALLFMRYMRNWNKLNEEEGTG